MSSRALLLAAALLAAAQVLRADPALRRAFESAMMAQARAVSCAAQVWAPALDRFPASWSLAGDAVAPDPGPWTAVTVAVAAGSATATAQVRVRLLPCVEGWRLRTALPPGTPLDPSALAADCFDPRALAGPPLTGPLPDGASSARALRPGDALLQADVAVAGRAKAGDRVTLEVREGDIVAGDDGVLLDGGCDGCEVRAQHRGTGKLVHGRLIGRTVLVED